MTGIVVATDAPHRDELARDLAFDGVDVLAVVDPADVVTAASAPSSLRTTLELADVLVLRADRTTLVPDVVRMCDAFGVRIVALCATEADRRLAAAFGTAPTLPRDITAEVLVRALSAPLVAVPERSASDARIIAVWGAAGAPGRSTVAVEIAAELARTGRRVCLVDADSHAPSLAIALGLPDDGPGLAAACRRAELGGLDLAELTRVSASVDAGGAHVDVLAGLNRPSRWPELSASRLSAVLAACRGWTDEIVVDVAGSLEADEEIVSDLDGPRRNAATLAVLAASDMIVAVTASDPIGISRFIRAHADLRARVPATPVRVVANRVRASALGIDARGQIRRSLARFAGIDDVSFIPDDPRAVDAAVLSGRPVLACAPRSALAGAVRRFVAESLAGTGRDSAAASRRRASARGRGRRNRDRRDAA